MSRRRRAKKKRDMRKGIYILPNLFTTASLFSGFFAIISSIDGHFYWACLAILASLVFDGLDGRVARATGSASAFGVEYDSLADLVAFGVAPAIMFYQWALTPLGRVGFVVTFLFVACGALRLARFNVQTGASKTKHFVGLPIPAAASMLATTIMFWQQLGFEQPIQPWVCFAMLFILSFLMVSNIPYLSFKEMGLAKLRSFNGTVAILLFFVLVAIQPHVMGFLLLAAYVAGGPLAARLLSRKQAAAEEKAGQLSESSLS